MTPGSPLIFPQVRSGLSAKTFWRALVDCGGHICDCGCDGAIPQAHIPATQKKEKSFMFYKLRDSLALRGWTDSPHAVRDLRSNEVTLLDEVTFQALGFCNGMVDCDSPFILPAHKNILAELEKNNAIIPCEFGESMRPDQKYKAYHNKFMSKAHWSITGKCNMRCRHCYMSAPQAKYGELALEQCLGIVEQLSQAGIGQVSLTGGEPFVRSDFFALLDALLDGDIRITEIYTNGLLIRQSLLDEFHARGLRPEFSLSFDGVDWHDWMRGVRGAEKRTIEAIRMLRKNDFPVSVESAFHTGSIGSLAKTLDLLADLGVRHWKTNPASPSGNWTQEAAKYSLSIEELYEAYLDLIPYYLSSGSPLTVMLGGFFYCKKGSTDYMLPCKKFDGSEQMEHMILCSSARNTLYIAADGRILPCIPMSGLEGQEHMPCLLEMPLTDALTASAYLERVETRLRNLLDENEKCAHCVHKYICGGGCRAGALAGEGKYLGSDEYTCFFFRNNYERKIAEAASLY